MSSTRSTLPGLLIFLAALGLVALAPTDADAKRKKKVPVAEVAETAKVGSEGTVTIFSLTNGATIEIDGKLVGTVPMETPFKLAVGQHSIKVELRGFTPHIDTFQVAGDEETELEIDLIPVAGIVKITTAKPGATVKVNGKVVGVTPFDQDVRIGKAEFTVSLPGHETWKEAIDVIPGKAYTYDLQLKELPPDMTGKGPAFYETWWFWTVIGVAVAGGAAATAVALTSDTAAPGPVADFTVQVP
jgi:hypothetical protein